MKMTQDSFEGDWFDTGDLAIIDEDGYVKLSGRTKDIIVRGGENIPVAYVENALYEDPRIEAVAVVGMPDERLQERAAACVVLKPGASLTFEEMQQLLRDKGVAKPYWPERLDILDELPRTASGKIQKFALRDRYQETS
jgi:acyl-CoA synthetase (AMP-forming)/AMP-acid ligase II